MSKGLPPIPSYRKPPIIEAVWSVQFAEMPWLLPPHTGLFWSRVRECFPRCEDKPPIMHVIESENVFSGPTSTAEVLMAPPLSRQWFLSESGTELIQLQRDRFCFNWRRVRDTDSYPRYEHMRTMFQSEWTEFCDFISAMGEPAPAVDQCEMTYINHMEQGQGWDRVEEVGGVFPSIRWDGSASFLPSPRTLGARMAFDLPDLNGRLHVSLRHGIRTETSARGTHLFLLELTARGLPGQTDLPGLLAWFAQARDSIVRGFTDLTSGTMHTLWEREQ